MLEKLKRIIVVVGHYGSGKTNLSVNLALDLNAKGCPTTLIDLDIVNPYFRSADFGELMEQRGIELIAPPYARSNVDLPSLTGQVDSAIDSGRHLVIDVGGDDAGAAALGRYSAEIAEAGGCDMLYVVNGYRYLTRYAEEAEEILAEIERKSRLKVTGVVNNSNISNETTAEHILETIPFAQEVADRYQVPLLFTSAAKPLIEKLKKCAPDRRFYPVEIYVKKPWEV